MSATRRPAVRSLEPASDSRSPSRSWRWRAAASGSRAPSARARSSTSRCRCRLVPVQELRDQRLEVVHAVFTERGKPAAAVGARAQAFLHLLADRDVLLLDLILERDGLLH